MNKYAEIKSSMLEKKIWAVIGATNNPDKFGNKIYKRLKAEGYSVYPVNPIYEDIGGDKCYPDLTALPERPEVLNMVVSPKKGKEFVEEAAQLGIENIWLQPGTSDPEILALIKEKGLTAIQACVLETLGQ